MKCPRCNSGQNTIIGGAAYAEVNEELRQVQRVRACRVCDQRWDTLEMDKAEVQRLRRLAHWAVMQGVKT